MYLWSFREICYHFYGGIQLNLKELKEIIDRAYKRAEGCDRSVEVWLNNSMYSIKDAGLFSAMPTIIITLGEKMYERDNE